jgi:hypothetical protein
MAAPYPVARIQRQARAKRPGCGRGGSAGGRGGLGYGGGFGLVGISPALSSALQGSCERERHEHRHGVRVVFDDFSEA